MRRRPSECKSVTRETPFHPLQPPQTEAVEGDGAAPSGYGTFFSLTCLSVKSLHFYQETSFESTLYTPREFVFRLREEYGSVKSLLTTRED